jgi:peptidyl-prolyl cis-trans isomerase C
VRLPRSPPRLSVPVALLFATAGLLTTSAPYADDDAARRAAVVAHVGPSVVTVGELEDKLAPIPRFQLRTFGATPQEVARKFLDQVIVRDALLALGAEDAHLDQDPATKHAIARTLAAATIRKVREQTGIANAIPMDEVQRYYDAHRGRYDMQDRVNVWRILCATRDEAQTVLDAAKKDPTFTTFTQLARAHSMDRATYMRGGNMGFAGDDGVSNEPGVRIDPAIVAAAKTVKDGELVPAPVQEGTSFAVVWRRGTMAGQHHTVDQVAQQIREVLWHQREEAAEKALTDKLRADKVKDENDILLGTFDIAVTDGTIKPRKRPGQVPPK